MSLSLKSLLKVINQCADSIKANGIDPDKIYVSFGADLNGAKLCHVGAGKSQIVDEDFHFMVMEFATNAETEKFILEKYSESTDNVYILDENDNLTKVH